MVGGLSGCRHTMPPPALAVIRLLRMSGVAWKQSMPGPACAVITLLRMVGAACKRKMPAYWPRRMTKPESTAVRSTPRSACTMGPAVVLPRGWRRARRECGHRAAWSDFRGSGREQRVPHRQGGLRPGPPVWKGKPVGHAGWLPAQVRQRRPISGNQALRYEYSDQIPSMTVIKIRGAMVVDSN